MHSSSGEDLDTPVVPTNDFQVPPGPMPNSSNIDREPEDFSAETDGKVAPIQRGTCNRH
jgi:hypothetical protein